MATVIRLKRIGALNRPLYRIVATDSRNPRDGRFIEEIGFYDTQKDPALIKVNKERAKYWLSVGAKPSPIIKNIFKKAGV